MIAQSTTNIGNMLRNRGGERQKGGKERGKAGGGEQTALTGGTARGKAWSEEEEA